MVKGKKKGAIRSIFMGMEGDQCVVKRKEDSSFVEWRVKFARGYLANGQIKGLVDNLWRFQSFNARHKTPITAEGESEDPREGSRSSSPSVAFGLV